MSERLILVVLYCAGVALTTLNGWWAYSETVRQLRHLAHTVRSSSRYLAEEDSASDQPTVPAESGASRNEQPGNNPPSPLSAHHLLDYLVETLRQSRIKLLLAGLGLVLTAVASIWSLLL